MRLLSTEGVSILGTGEEAVLGIEPETLEHLATQAFRGVSHFLCTDQLAQLRAILDCPDAPANDRYVALDLLRNANVSVGGVLPMC